MSEILSEKKVNKLFRKGTDFKPFKGAQERVLQTVPACDIILFGGSRGGGKSGVLCFDSAYDLHNPNFRATFVRKKLVDLQAGGSIFDQAKKFLTPLGVKFTTTFKGTAPSGAQLIFKHCQNEDPKEIEESFQGLESAAYYFDEITQSENFYTFLYLLTSNRNSHGIKNRFIATCNPDPYSWVRRLLDQRFIDCSGGPNDGYIIPEMDGKVQYFYIYGKTEEDIIWGDTKEEVVEAAGGMLKLTDSMVKKGAKVEDLVMSMTMIKGDVAENEILMKDGEYLKKIAKGGEESFARNFSGNWHVTLDGDEMVKRKHVDKTFDQNRGYKKSGKKFITFDLAFGGADLATFFMWDGHHLLDIRTRKKLGGGELEGYVRALCKEFGVPEDNVAYDVVGIGQAVRGEKGLLPKAVPIHGNDRDFEENEIYENLKACLYYRFAYALIDGEITIADHLRNKTLPYGKKKEELKTLYDILQNERRVLKDLPTEGKKKAMSKKDAIQLLGFSPDYLEGMMYIKIFDVQNKTVEVSGLQYL